jgi:hypothetical protein
MDTYGFLWQADLETADAVYRSPCCSTSALRKTTSEKPAKQIRTSCSRNHRCSSDARSPRSRRTQRYRPALDCSSAPGSSDATIRVVRLRWPPSRLGTAQDRLLHAPASVEVRSCDRIVPSDFNSQILARIGDPWRPTLRTESLEFPSRGAQLWVQSPRAASQQSSSRPACDQRRIFERIGHWASCPRYWADIPTTEHC